MKIINLLKGAALVLLILSVAACAGGALYNPGTYTGEGQGHGGPIKVAVTVNEKKIVKIEVLESSESDFSKPVFEEIINSALANNTAEVDAVSGATETSNGLLGALKDAVSKALAGNGKTAVKADKAAEKLIDLDCDVVIIGAGGAGLSAAIEAHDAGVKVIIVEKMPLIGGNTNYATGGLNAAGTVSQNALGIEDSVETFVSDTMTGGKNLNNPGLVQILAENSAGTINWLIGLGGDFTDVGRLGGATNNRAHRPTGGAAVGNHLVQVLYKAAQDRGITIMTESKVVEIINDGGRAAGVVVESGKSGYKVTAGAVVIASGGFGADNAMVASFDPSLKGFGTTNHPGATGDALEFVKPFNVALVDITEIQTHPTVVPVKNTMITEAVRGNGAILVNRNAERFISELETRDVVSAAELEQEGQTAFLFFDQGVRESLSAIEKYAKAGLLTEGATIEDIAAKMELDAASLKATVDKYNGFVAAGSDSDFDRPDMPRTIESGPFYMVEVGPAVHHTMGGLKIDTEARVVNEAGDVIPGLYAAGEVTGGVHGGNRLGGNALSDITTFGRIAGANAAALTK
ncbi:MAG: flavocytochrome c [Spirochaetales bacterium]|nr:flavocytochrome c [Spirochaetales bacterium]